MRRHQFLPLLALVSLSASAQFIPHAPAKSAYCLNPSGVWIPVLTAQTASTLPNGAPATDLYALNSTAWYGIACDANGNLFATPTGAAGGVLSGIYPNPGLSASPQAIPNGWTATTQPASDNSTKVATMAALHGDLSPSSVTTNTLAAGTSIATGGATAPLCPQVQRGVTSSSAARITWPSALRLRSRRISRCCTRMRIRRGRCLCGPLPPEAFHRRLGARFQRRRLQRTWRTLSATGVTGVLPSANMGPPTATVSSGSIAAVTTNNTYIICTTTCNVTPLDAAAGVQLSSAMLPGSATVITLNALGASNYYELTTHSAWGTANHNIVSGGAVTDSICLVGYDATHYAVMSYTGTWTD